MPISKDLQSILRKTLGLRVRVLKSFAEILPRFISKRTSHKAHKRIFSDRDPLFYWLYALGNVGTGTSLGFITQSSEAKSSRSRLLLAASNASALCRSSSENQTLPSTGTQYSIGTACGLENSLVRRRTYRFWSGRRGLEPAIPSLGS